MLSLCRCLHILLSWHWGRGSWWKKWALVTTLGNNRALPHPEQTRVEGGRLQCGSSYLDLKFTSTNCFMQPNGSCLIKCLTSPELGLVSQGEY